MMLEAVWLREGQEVYKVSPVMNILCYEDMESIADIDINDRKKWHTYDDFEGEADDFVIRLKENEGDSATENN